MEQETKSRIFFILKHIFADESGRYPYAISCKGREGGEEV
jgi:hypothetical protein